MRIEFYFLPVLCIFSLMSGCTKVADIIGEKKEKVIVLQPFENFSPKETKKIQQEMSKFCSQIIINSSISLPEKAYYPDRNRYRADTLIRFLSKQIGKDTVIIGLTDKDISTTKGKHKDWGVMRLGYRPGKSCVISSFRLSKKNKSEQLYKVVLHEFGHTTGLDHCKDKSCLMRDAEGGNPLDEEKDFCIECKSSLQSKGFKL